jgi:hypothetical protein
MSKTLSLLLILCVCRVHAQFGEGNVLRATLGRAFQVSLGAFDPICESDGRGRRLMFRATYFGVTSISSAPVSSFKLAGHLK